MAAGEPVTVDSGADPNRAPKRPAIQRIGLVLVDVVFLLMAVYWLAFLLGHGAQLLGFDPAKDYRAVSVICFLGFIGFGLCCCIVVCLHRGSTFAYWLVTATVAGTTLMLALLICLAPAQDTRFHTKSELIRNRLIILLALCVPVGVLVGLRPRKGSD